MSWRATLVMLILDLAMAGCFSARRQFVPPPPRPIIAKPWPQPTIEEPPPIDLPLPPVAVAEVALNEQPEIETPPPKPVQRRRPAAPATPTPAPAPEGEGQPAAPVPAPQLTEILTDDRRKQYEAEFTGSISRAQAAVNRTSNRSLSENQKETVQRINTFVEQAQDARTRDLVTALQLARRADLLGQDLVRSLQ